MTESKLDPRQAARDHALETGGIPIDPYPGYLTWFFRDCVEAGAGSALDWLGRAFPEREHEILEAWCALSTRTGETWAWAEARSRLERLVVARCGLPDPLADFAIVPAPRSTTGPDSEGSRSTMVVLMARLLKSHGFDAHGVNEQFGASFPSPARKDAGSTLRKARGRVAGYVDPAFELQGGGVSGHEGKLSRPAELVYDWADPEQAARVLLTSEWPAFAVLWQLWPERCEERLRTWCDRARCELPIWNEVRALLDHMVYCRWTIPDPLRNIYLISRPASRPQPRFAPRIRLAGLERALKERGHSQLRAKGLCAAALGHPNLSDYTLQRDFSEGRERLGGLFS